MLAYLNNLKHQINEDIIKPRQRYLISEFIKYGNTKLLNIMMVKMFSEKLKHYGITSYAVDPWLTKTPMHGKTYDLANIKVPYFLYDSVTNFFSKVCMTSYM